MKLSKSAFDPSECEEGTVTRELHYIANKDRIVSEDPTRFCRIITLMTLCRIS